MTPDELQGHVDFEHMLAHVREESRSAPSFDALQYWRRMAIASWIATIAWIVLALVMRYSP